MKITIKKSMDSKEWKFEKPGLSKIERRTPGKPFNGIDEGTNSLERSIEAIELLGKLDRLFIKEWKVERVGNTKINRRTPVYFADHKEMFESLFEQYKADNPSRSVNTFQGILKVEINVLLKAITPYYYRKEGESSAPVNPKDERIAQANEFLEWLENPNSEATSSASKNLTIKQIALIHVYNGLIITRQNADEIAISHGHKSGEHLYHSFTCLSKRDNRAEDPGFSKKLNNKIVLIESVLPHLNIKGKETAMDELNKLKEILDRYY
ncbi:MAG: hypothetical protein JXA79_12425 [Deltaproteobacteria bacterium]|nr:hypothetical protein [Deltaproteobacteria bacterium]